MRRLHANPVWSAANRKALIESQKTEEWREKNLLHMKDWSADPLRKEKHNAGIKKRNDDPVWRKNVSDAAKRLSQNPQWKENNAAMLRERAKSPEWREKIRVAAFAREARKRAKI